MATIRKSSASAAAAAAVLLALIAASVLLAPAEASSLTVFTGPGCNGRSKFINNVCGCYAFTGYQSGLDFVFGEGIEAYLHKSPNCGDRQPVRLTKSTRYCYHTEFKSVKMLC